MLDLHTDTYFMPSLYEAVDLHQKMYGDMQRELGDNPSPGERNEYKRIWIMRRGLSDVTSDCFLCEFAQCMRVNELCTRSRCHYCPIDWSPLMKESVTQIPARCYEIYKNGIGAIHLVAPISEILALPVKGGKTA